MPTLDDAKVLQVITGAQVASTDILYLYDVDKKTVKAITLAELVTALDALGLAADV